MTQVPVLAVPNFSKPIVIEVDASGFAVGAVLMQDDKPIAFHNQVLGQRAHLKLVMRRNLWLLLLLY